MPRGRAEAILPAASAILHWSPGGHRPSSPFGAKDSAERLSAKGSARRATAGAEFDRKRRIADGQSRRIACGRPSE